MKITTGILGALLCLVACGGANARATSGEEILNKCKQVETSALFDSGFCAGYITAVLETLSMWEASDMYQKRSHDSDVSFCLPAEVTNGQLIRVFVKYLEDHPEELHKPANVLMIGAFRKAFPCKQ